MTQTFLLHRAAFAAFALILLGLAGCAEPTSRELQPGSYRAVIDVGDGRQVPFGLDVAREERGLVLYLVNGDERLRVPEVDASPDKVTAQFPGFESGFTARVAGGRLEGTLTLAHPDDRRREWPLEAKLGETWRFHPEALTDNADVSGRWDVTFTDAAGKTSRAVAELRQRFAEVSGTVIGPAADQRYLAGEVHDEELRLSRFDGGAALLYSAKLDAQGRLVGEFWSDRGALQRFVAVRNADAAVDTTAVATRVRNPDAPLQFAFRDLQGHTVSSSDPRFAGKVTLVTLGGSWCPNDHDAAAMLVEIDRKYRAQGLAIVALMFEQHPEFERAAAAVERFRSAYGIEYPTLVAGPMDKALAAQALPQLDGVRAYPTLIFVDRAGRVRKIHTGFRGPATGVLHEMLVQEMEQTIETLLAEAAPNAPTAAAVSRGSS